MLDSPWHHTDLEDPTEVRQLSELGFAFLARRLLQTNRRETRALLFDALLEKDKEVYGTRKDLSRVLNPYR